MTCPNCQAQLVWGGRSHCTDETFYSCAECKVSVHIKGLTRIKVQKFLNANLTRRMGSIKDLENLLVDFASCGVDR